MTVRLLFLKYIISLQKARSIFIKIIYIPTNCVLSTDVKKN